MGIGVKAAVWPLHSWLPRAMIAPAPVSALLHAVAVVKAGAFGIVRIVYDVYGVQTVNSLGVLGPLAIIAAVTIVYGSTLALFQDGLKKRLAFSTVSQVSYIVLGAGIFGPKATTGGLVHLVHQGLMKITLFFGAGNYAETLGVYKVSEMNGVGRRMPLTTVAFSLAALGMIGVPFLSGYTSKQYLLAGAEQAGAGRLGAEPEQPAQRRLLSADPVPSLDQTLDRQLGLGPDRHRQRDPPRRSCCRRWSPPPWCCGPGPWPRPRSAFWPGSSWWWPENTAPDRPQRNRTPLHETHFPLLKVTGNRRHPSSDGRAAVS